MQNIELANKLINWDLSIRYIAVLAIRGLKERPKNFKVRHQNKVLGMKRFMNFQESQKQHAEQVFAAFNSGQGEPEQDDAKSENSDNLGVPVELGNSESRKIEHGKNGADDVKGVQGDLQ